MNSRYNRGMDTLQKLTGDQGKALIENIGEVSTDFANFMVEFGFGDVYSRPGLDLKQRELITLTSLITQGADQHQLYFHMNSALNVGLTSEEILEIIIQCAAYAGFSRASSAIMVAKQVFAER